MWNTRVALLSTPPPPPRHNSHDVFHSQDKHKCVCIPRMQSSIRRQSLLIISTTRIDSNPQMCFRRSTRARLTLNARTHVYSSPPHHLYSPSRLPTQNTTLRGYIYVYTVPAHSMKNAPNSEKKRKRRREKRSKRIVVERKRKEKKKKTQH